MSCTQRDTGTNSFVLAFFFLLNLSLTICSLESNHRAKINIYRSLKIAAKERKPRPELDSARYHAARGRPVDSAPTHFDSKPSGQGRNDDLVKKFSPGLDHDFAKPF